MNGCLPGATRQLKAAIPLAASSGPTKPSRPVRGMSAKGREAVVPHAAHPDRQAVRGSPAPDQSESFGRGTNSGCDCELTTGQWPPRPGRISSGRADRSKSPCFLVRREATPAFAGAGAAIPPGLERVRDCFAALAMTGHAAVAMTGHAALAMTGHGALCNDRPRCGHNGRPRCSHVERQRCVDNDPRALSLIALTGEPSQPNAGQPRSFSAITAGARGHTIPNAGSS